MAVPAETTDVARLVNGKKPDKTEKSKNKDEPDLSEEDQQLKTDLELLVQRLREPQHDLYQSAIDSLGSFIRTSTSSMTAVPKPLKFLRPHYHELQDIYNRWTSDSVRDSLGDVLSVLAMTYSDGKRDCLRYRLSSSKDDPTSWGHEYIRHLATEIGEERAERIEKEEPAEDLMKLTLTIVPFFLSHNAEADAVDLLLEMEAVDELIQMVDKDTYSKVCLYMLSCVSVLSPPDDRSFLIAANAIYRKYKQSAAAMLVAIRLDHWELIWDTMEEEQDELVKQQLGFLLSRAAIWLVENDRARAPLDNAMRNARKSEYFLASITDLSLTDPRVPEDIYKSHLEPSKSVFGAPAVDSAKQNLASTFVNAFVNAGYGTDKLIMTEDEKQSWIYKNKDGGQTSAVASIGLLNLWNVDAGLAELDKYLYSEDEYIKAGAILGVGVLLTGVHHEAEPDLALLEDYLGDKNTKLRVNAIAAIGLAHAGSQKDDLEEVFLPLVTDLDANIEVSAMAALTLGLIFVGSGNGEISSAILQTLMEREPDQLNNKWTRFMVLGLAFIYTGKQDQAEVALATLKAIDNPIAKHAEVLVDIMAYAGTGNVLKIQQMLHLTADHLPVEDDKEPEDMFQAFATIGIAMIAMGEDVGTDMALRQFGHLMHYGDPIIRKAVPLALGLLSASNPQMKVFETLSRYSHDSDLDVAVNAIFAMGLVGAGTNNARLAQLLRALASYYSREPNCLFMVRIAQGLLHAGKGTMSINPFQSDRTIYSRAALASLMVVFVSMLDAKSFILDNSHWLLYYLIPALQPRMLITIGEDGEPVPVSVRVGQAVDSFGPGKPRKITGWVTQTTPVLLNYEQRAELATEEWSSITPVLEGIVIVKKNPNYEE